jgi:hypothetical protein
LEEVAEEGQQMLLGLIKANTLGQIHDSICNEISDSPALIFSILLDIWKKVSSNFLKVMMVNISNGYLWWKVFAEDDARINTLHLDRILFVLEELAKYLQ